MLVSITSTSPDATDLGFVLHKHPDRVRSVDVGFGHAHVFYPEATPERCTATLYVEVDPVGLTRKRGGRRSRTSGGQGAVEPYVNDRPYAASSMLSVAIGRLFGSALNGTCDARPELVDRELALEVSLPTVPVRGGDDLLARLFGPLGYEIDSEAIPLDRQFADWGSSRYVEVTLRITSAVQRVLEHLYVLLPVLDDRKHYWIGQTEVDKLLRRGGEWLANHPESDLITRRYLRRSGHTREALARLSELATDPDELDELHDTEELAVERPISLNEQRLDAVADAVRAAGGGRVVDLGCGEGRLLQRLIAESTVTELLGLDVSLGALDRAGRRLRIDKMSERRREGIELLQGSLTYTDDRLRGFDVAVAVEVIEHIDLDRLDVFANVLFEDAVPSTVIITTPNREYNVTFEGFDPAKLRHGDHRFEWTRKEFAEWVDRTAERYGYRVERSGIGAEHPEFGHPTQMAVFSK